MKIFIWTFLLCFLITNLDAQMVKPAAGIVLNDHYDTSVTLKNGEYIVQGEVLISNTAILTIEAGAKIFFMPGASIRINGGLHINGEPKNLVQLSSAGGKESGTGLVISGSAANTDIKITYASFKFLLKPLNFEKDWYRAGVDIVNSDFFNTYEFNDAVSVQEVDFYTNKQPLSFNFKNNVFADNYANISVYNATSYRVRFSFENNVFANNLYFDSRSKAESNPLYVGLDEIPGKFTMQTFNNAFSDNYIFTQDSLDLIDYGTIGFIHAKSDFVTQNNFVNNAVEKTYIQKEPVFNLHAFPLTYTVEGKMLSQNIPVDSLAKKNIGIHFNTPIAAVQNDFRVFYNYMDTVTGEILKRQIDKNIEFKIASGNDASFTFDSTVLTEPIGYLSLENLKNPDGVSVPSVNFGIVNFFKKIGERNYKMEYVTLAPICISNINSKMVDTTKNMILERDTLLVEPKWEGSFFLGVSGYAGDLNHNLTHQDQWYTALMLRAKYHINRSLTTNFLVEYTNVSATDYGPYKLRNLNFKSFIYSANVMMEYTFSERYHLRTENEKVRLTRSKFYPSIGVGLGVIHFDPMGEYLDGKWYELRQFGTEGENLQGGKKYSLYALSIPMSASLYYKLNYRTKIGIEVKANKLFTDYLDDSHNVAYSDPNAINAAYLSTHPNANPYIAGYFSNPGNNLGARGNPHNADFYYTMGFTINYVLNSKKIVRAKEYTHSKTYKKFLIF